MSVFQLGLSLMLVLIMTGTLQAGSTGERASIVWNASNPHGLEWQIVNDSVMGGVSDSSMTMANTVARFNGVVSLENNGGFASVRTRPAQLELPPDRNTFVIRVRGDGNTYKFTARRGESMDGINYQLEFKTQENEWQEIRLPMKEFKASWRGRPLPEEPELKPSAVVSIGFLIASEQSGPFRLEIDWIKAVP